MFLTPALLQQDPGAQSATVDPTVNVGDVLHTAINGPAAMPEPGRVHRGARDTAAVAAAAIAAALNASTTPDPATGLPLNAGSTPRARAVCHHPAGFTLACAAPARGHVHARGRTPLSPRRRP